MEKGVDMRNKKRRTTKKLLPVLHIFCEGAKTEPNYIARYKDLFCGNAIAIKVEKTDKNTPVQLVQTAVCSKESGANSSLDEYWVVYDRESPMKYSERLHAQARDLARQNGICIALSNVCFEVWLLLHKQATCAACNTCAELLARNDFKVAFRGYEKGGSCTLTREQIKQARERAKRLNANTIACANKDWNVPSKWNPYTDVYKLLEAIDLFLGRLSVNVAQ
mgnify:FL=1